MIKFPFRKEREFYRLFHSILGFYPNNVAPYKQALLHKSLSIRGEHGLKLNNERLEFLGDAVLDAIVADIAYQHFPNKSEGFLTNTRSKIVQRESLNKIAVQIGLDKLVKSDTNVQHSHNSYIGGNAFEALMGAIYLDRGYRACKRFIEERILRQFIDLEKVANRELNFKSKLIEWGQKNKINTTFELVKEGNEEGHNPTFHTQAMVEGIVCGEGKGHSKKESQQLAAKDAIARLKRQKGLLQEVLDEKAKRLTIEEESTASLPNLSDHGTEPA